MTDTNLGPTPEDLFALALDGGGSRGDALLRLWRAGRDSTRHQLDAERAASVRLRTAMQEAYDALNGFAYEREEIAGLLFDALGLDGAPQGGGVTDPHETSGPPAVKRTPEENAEAIGLLARWTNMHHMSVTRGTLDAVDRGADIPGLLDAECARLVEHECGWQNERQALAAGRFTSRPPGGTRVRNLRGVAGTVTEWQTSDDPQQVRVQWYDGHTTNIRCEQLRPAVTA